MQEPGRDEGKPMTDKQKLKSLLKEFGVEFKESDDGIVCSEGSKKVKGYISFYTVFEFDNIGHFENMGAYEG